MNIDRSLSALSGKAFDRVCPVLCSVLLIINYEGRINIRTVNYGKVTVDQLCLMSCLLNCL